jgi:hypothetical protein
MTSTVLRNLARFPCSLGAIARRRRIGLCWGLWATLSTSDRAGRVTEEQILAFLRAHIRSLWALELLLLLARDRGKAWQPSDLVREMRSSPVAVGEALRNLQSAGLAASDADNRYRYSPASAELDALASGIAQAYSVRPSAVVKAIVTAPDDKLRIFADAFRLKDQ